MLAGWLARLNVPALLTIVSPRAYRQLTPTPNALNEIIITESAPVSAEH